MHKLFFLVSLALGLMGCAFLGQLVEQQSPGPPPEPSPVVLTPAANRAPDERWQPPLSLTWQWQLTDNFEPAIQADVYDLDLFETDAALLASLRSAGKHTICYLSAGSYEDWRPDAGLFPPEVIGAAYEGWPGERWLDIRQMDRLAAALTARLELCQQKGFNAVEPDNIDGYTNDTGFPLSAADQLAFNRWLAGAAHARGLSIGLKNDPEQAAALAGDFDWALTEDCFAEGWCEAMLPFTRLGKPVLMAEYTDTGVDLGQLCAEARRLGFNAILKDRALGAERQTCD